MKDERYKPSEKLISSWRATIAKGDDLIRRVEDLIEIHPGYPGQLKILRESQDLLRRAVATFEEHGTIPLAMFNRIKTLVAHGRNQAQRL